MRIKDVMNTNVITIDETSSIHDAKKVMDDNKIRRLPVVDESGRLIGIITERMLLEAAPSPATSLSIHELNYLLAKMIVGDLMVKNPLSIPSNMPVEQALKLGQEKGFGAFPVVDDNKLVGIVTESDITRLITHIFGVNDEGVRIDIEIDKSYGNIQKMMSVLDELKATLLSLMVFNMSKDDSGPCHIFIRLKSGNGEEIAGRLRSSGFTVIDVD